MNTLFENEFLAVEMVTPNYPFFQMKKSGIVTIPLWQDKIGLIKKMRNNQVGFELPRGFGDSLDEIKTFNQKIGMEHVEEVISLGTLQADTGVMNDSTSVLLVKLSNQTKTDEVFWVTDIELLHLIQRNEITCGLTLSAAMKYISRIVLASSK